MSNEIETKTVETEATTAEQTPESAQAPEKRVIIESSMNENDALALNRAAFKRFLWLFLLLGGVLLVVGILGLFDPEEGSVGPILLMVFAAAVPFLGYAFTMFLARKSIRSNAAIGNDMRQRFTFTARSVIIEQKSAQMQSTSEYAWSMFFRAVEDKNYFYMYTSGSTSLIVNKRNVLEGSLDELTEMMRAALGVKFKKRG